MKSPTAFQTAKACANVLLVPKTRTKESEGEGEENRYKTRKGSAQKSVPCKREERKQEGVRWSGEEEVERQNQIVREDRERVGIGRESNHEEMDLDAARRRRETRRVQAVD